MTMRSLLLTYPVGNGLRMVTAQVIVEDGVPRVGHVATDAGRRLLETWCRDGLFHAAGYVSPTAPNFLDRMAAMIGPEATAC